MSYTYSELPGFVTQVVLIEAAQAGIKTIGIRQKHKLLPNSMHWNFFDNCLFAEERDIHWHSKLRTGWPTIWRVAEEVGINAGCGNTGQYQIYTGDGLEPGVWKLDGIHWERIA